MRSLFARNFYGNARPERIESLVGDFSPPDEPDTIRAGIVPHAGWDFSGQVAARVFHAIRARSNPEALVLLGAVHRWGTDRHALYDRGGWTTPLGPVSIQEDLADRIAARAAGSLARDPRAHDGEHSIEVQMPFVRHYFPGIQVVPISVLPEASATDLGRAVAEGIKEWGRTAVVVGTTDLTHYGASYAFTPKGTGPEAQAWMEANDRRLLDLAVAMRADEIFPEVNAHQNACGAGALAATIQAASELGASRGVIVEYTTSHRVFPEPRFTMGVGYAGMVF